MKVKLIICLVLSFAFTNIFSQETEIKIVSWNIQLLPNGPAIFSKDLRKMQKKRLPWIIEHCNNADYDIIVFQEVFDLQLKRKLKKQLIKVYPYQINTKTKFGRLTSNGVLIVSKIPIKYIDHIIYKKGVTEDGWAAKGCTLIEAEKNGVVFQVAGTHLQSGGSDEAKEHRHSQYKEIRTLLAANKIDNVPVLVVGDMNTRKANETCYNDMLSTIGVKNFPLNEKDPYTIDGHNYWNNHKQGIQLDYILLNDRGTCTIITEQKVLRLKQEFNTINVDLSDHYGVVSKIKISNN